MSEVEEESWIRARPVGSCEMQRGCSDRRRRFASGRADWGRGGGECAHVRFRPRLGSRSRPRSRKGCPSATHRRCRCSLRSRRTRRPVFHRWERERATEVRGVSTVARRVRAEGGLVAEGLAGGPGERATARPRWTAWEGWGLPWQLPRPGSRPCRLENNRMEIAWSARLEMTGCGLAGQARARPRTCSPREAGRAERLARADDAATE